MKLIFLVNNAPFLMEILGKMAYRAIAEGDECVGIAEGKIAEYKKKRHFPPGMKFISKVDWCIENCQKDKKEFGSLSWRNIFFVFDRLKQTDFNYDNSLEMVSQIYQFLEFIFEKEKPDAIISEPSSGLLNSIAYYFCKLNKVSYLGLISSRFKNRIDVYDSEFTCSRYEKTFRELDSNNISEKEKQFANNFIKNFLSHKELPSYFGSEKVYFTQFGLLSHYLTRIKEISPSHFQYFLDQSSELLKRWNMMQLCYCAATHDTYSNRFLSGHCFSSFSNSDRQQYNTC